ncbi:hypothetical protein [Nocardia mexicana]|uniref:Outer membrane channel protein CpnT-like N-terminal domain-containing protein n=1 Tax=Nocardia mexicana TaxID=279262 RepID=A0A370GK19_9NOCA|nr:hypothetical protein [Nocardia mexicana]RDI43609.1 hypothetical protein DFR68_12076 [Nocardia mexicana]
MGIELPEGLRWLGWVAGAAWPDGDETAMRAVAYDWQTASRGLRALLPDIDAAARGTVAAYPDGDGGAKMGALYGELRSGDKSLESLAQHLATMSDSTFDMGTEIEGQKLAVIVSLAVLAIEILWAWRFPPTAPAEQAGLIAAARSFLRLLEDKLIARVAQATAWMGPRLQGIATKYLVKIGEAMLISGAIDGGVQIGQMAGGTRRNFNGLQFGTSLVAAGVASPVGRKFSDWAGAKSYAALGNKLDNPWLRSAVGSGIGATTGLVGTFASNIPAGLMTGDWAGLFGTPHGWAGAAARGGIVGSQLGMRQKTALPAGRNFEVDTVAVPDRPVADRGSNVSRNEDVTPQHRRGGETADNHERDGLAAAPGATSSSAASVATDPGGGPARPESSPAQAPSQRSSPVGTGAGQSVTHSSTEPGAGPRPGGAGSAAAGGSQPGFVSAGPGSEVAGSRPEDSSAGRSVEAGGVDDSRSDGPGVIPHGVGDEGSPADPVGRLQWGRNEDGHAVFDGPDGTRYRVDEVGDLLVTRPGDDVVLQVRSGASAEVIDSDHAHTRLIGKTDTPYTRPDGTTHVVLPDGSMRTRGTDGSITTVRPNGWVRTEADGRTTVVKPDGTTVESDSATGAVVVRGGRDDTALWSGSSGRMTQPPDGSVHVAADRTDPMGRGIASVSLPDGTRGIVEMGGHSIKQLGAELQDGKVRLNRPDGVELVWDPKGKAHIKLPDDTVVVKDAEGVVRVTEPGGTVHEIRPDADGGVTALLPKLGGLEVSKTPDGLQVRHKDGTVSAVGRNGLDGRDGSDSRGGVTTTDKHGVVRETLSNGQVRTGYPDGTGREVRSDGSMEATRPDGTKWGVRPDGSTWKVDARDATRFEDIDGTRVTVEPDGPVTVFTPDGTHYIATDPETFPSLTNSLGMRKFFGVQKFFGIELPRDIKGAVASVLHPDGTRGIAELGGHAQPGAIRVHRPDGAELSSDSGGKVGVSGLDGPIFEKTRRGGLRVDGAPVPRGWEWPAGGTTVKDVPGGLDVMHKDGSKSEIRFDGIKITDTSGVERSLMPDGMARIQHPVAVAGESPKTLEVRHDGATRTELPDGSGRGLRPDGTTWTRDKDGRYFVTDPDGAQRAPADRRVPVADGSDMTAKTRPKRYWRIAMPGAYSAPEAPGPDEWIPPDGSDPCPPDPCPPDPCPPDPCPPDPCPPDPCPPDPCDSSPLGLMGNALPSDVPDYSSRLSRSDVAASLWDPPGSRALPGMDPQRPLEPAPQAHAPAMLSLPESSPSDPALSEPDSSNYARHLEDPVPTKGSDAGPPGLSDTQVPPGKPETDASDRTDALGMREDGSTPKPPWRPESGPQVGDSPFPLGTDSAGTPMLPGGPVSPGSLGPPGFSGTNVADDRSRPLVRKRKPRVRLGKRDQNEHTDAGGPDLPRSGLPEAEIVDMPFTLGGEGTQSDGFGGPESSRRKAIGD